MNYFARLLRDATLRLDKRLGTRVKPRLGDSYRNFLGIWSRVRRVVDPVMIKITFRMLPKPSPVKLHLGCGPKRLDGYINVDMWMTEATDVICDIYKLPWPTESIDVIESHHVIEHISHRKIEDTFRQWHRVLKPGGHLYLETPHFDRTIKEYLVGNEERLLSIFGQQRRTGDTHFYGYNPERLSRLLSKVGFVDFRETPPESHQAKEEPVFRLECSKRLLEQATSNSEA